MLLEGEREQEIGTLFRTPREPLRISNLSTSIARGSIGSAIVSAKVQNILSLFNNVSFQPSQVSPHMPTGRPNLQVSAKWVIWRHRDNSQNEFHQLDKTEELVVGRSAASYPLSWGPICCASPGVVWDHPLHSRTWKAMGSFNQLRWRETIPRRRGHEFALQLWHWMGGWFPFGLKWREGT
jgi:hypothetical protein